MHRALLRRTFLLRRLHSLILLAVLFSALPVAAAPGELDSSFGVGGLLHWTPDPDLRFIAEDVAMQGPKIIVVGTIYDFYGDNDGFIARFWGNGQLDTGFGGGAGYVRFNVDSPSWRPSDGLTAVDIQEDGKIVVAGYTDYLQAGYFDLLVARYEIDGSLDISFSSDGFLVDSEVGEGRDVLVQPDGKIVALAVKQYGGQDRDFAFARFDSQGQLDSGFGYGGKYFLPFDLPGSDLRDEPRAMALLSSGKIVAVGGANTGTDPIGYSRVVATRLGANGLIESSFANGGRFVGGWGEDAIEWGSGVIESEGGVLISAIAEGDFAVLALDQAGALDASFGTGGRATLDFVHPAFSNDNAYDLVDQGDGKILLAGGVTSPDHTQAEIGVARMLPGGQGDASFSLVFALGGPGAGMREYTFSSSSLEIGRAATLSHGGAHLIVAGSYFNPSTGQEEVALAKVELYHSFGSLP